MRCLKGLAMQDYRGRPLTRHEIQVRLLFQYADEIIKKLEFLNYSADKLERLEVIGEQQFGRRAAHAASFVSPDNSRMYERANVVSTLALGR